MLQEIEKKITNDLEKFRVLGSKLLVEPIELNNKTENGLIIPEQIMKKKRIIDGIVVKTGSEVKEVKVGDRVLYERYTAADVKIDDKDFHIIGNEAQMHGVFGN